MNIGWAGKSVYFTAKIGTWQASRTVKKRDISAIFGMLDVPTYAADFSLRQSDGSPGPEATTGLADAVKAADSVDVEIRDGSATGPVLIAGSISLGIHHDRLAAIVSALDEIKAKLAANGCDAP
jgi:hypothetical protein